MFAIGEPEPRNATSFSSMNSGMSSSHEPATSSMTTQDSSESSGSHSSQMDSRKQEIKKRRAKLQLIVQNVTANIVESQRSTLEAEQLRVQKVCEDSIQKQPQVDSSIREQACEIKPEILREGFLYKESKVLKVWRKRWFVLTSSSLYSYKNENESPMLSQKKETTPTEFIRLDECTCVRALPNSTKQKNVLSIDTPDRTLLLSADTESERDAWTEAVNDACLPLMVNSGFRGRRLSKFCISEEEECESTDVGFSPRSEDESTDVGWSPRL